MVQEYPTRRPRLLLIPIRVLLMTFLLVLLSLAVSLLLGILGIVIWARLHSVAPNMALAYRYVALPTALVVGGVALVSAVVMEVRHYRQSKALAEIERAA